MSLGWMNGKICRFIDDHQVFVLKKNGERHGDRNDMFRGGFHRKSYHEAFTGLQAVGRVDPFAVD